MKQNSFLTLVLAVTLTVTLSNTSYANDATEKNIYDDTFFEAHRKTVVLEELSSRGIDMDPTMTLDAIDDALIQKVRTEKSSDGQALLDKIEQLENAEYIYLTENGDVYSSEKGYIGKADKVEGTNEANESNITEIVSSNEADPTPSEIYGGTTGAFSRRQLGFEGFDGIISNVTLPSVSVAIEEDKNDQETPWVYYGFDSLTKMPLEAGYGYQPSRKIWMAYIYANGYFFNTEGYKKSDGDTVDNVKFYLKKVPSATKYTAYLIDGADQIVMINTDYTSLSNLSVKYATSIAKKDFNGSNIYGKSMNQNFDSVQVSFDGDDYYSSWSDHKEYKEWKNNQWYGTIDCTGDYIHSNNGTTSIYKK